MKIYQFLRFGLDAAEAFVYLSPNEILTANGEMLDSSIYRSFYKINLKTLIFVKPFLFKTSNVL